MKISGLADGHHLGTLVSGGARKDRGDEKGRGDHSWALTAQVGGTSQAGSAAEATPKIRAAAATGKKFVKRMLMIIDNWYCHRK